MPVIHGPSNPKLYDYVKDRNLQSQWFLLETLVAYSLQSRNYSFTLDTLFALHHSAAVYIDDQPGAVRSNHNHIQNSKHTTPDPHTVPHHLHEYIGYLNQAFSTQRATQLAAYALWRLTWIHPFNECNGRTARAFSYLVLCRKIGGWLPGKTTVHELIRQNERDYYRGLEEADTAYKVSGKIDVSYLDEFFKRLLFAQVGSIPGSTA